MLEGKVNVEFDWDVDVPNCANLAVEEIPVLRVIEVSQRYFAIASERRRGISTEHLDQEVVKESLYEQLLNALPEDYPAPEIDDMELRYLPGQDGCNVWLDAILCEREG